MSSHVTALFYSPADAQTAIDAVIAMGIAPSDLSLMVSRSTAGKYLGNGTSRRLDERDEGGPLDSLAQNLVTAAADNASILATGPLMAELAGLGTNAFVGGISAGLCAIGIPEHEAVYYEYRLRSCDSLLLAVTTARHPPEAIKDFLSRFDHMGSPAHASCVRDGAREGEPALSTEGRRRGSADR